MSSNPTILIVAPEPRAEPLEPLWRCLEALPARIIAAPPGADAPDEAPSAVVVACDPEAPVPEGLEAVQPALAALGARGWGAKATLISPYRRGGGALLEALEAAEVAHLISWHDAGLWRQVALGVRRRLATGDARWGVAPWLEGAEVERREVTSSRQRDPLLDELGDFAAARGVNSRVATLAQSVADEFIINAVYNAPVDEAGAFRYARRSRTEAVELPQEDAATFCFASDGERLAVSIHDRFGSLTPETVRRYLLRGLRKGDDQIEHKDGGAGLGLYTVLEATTRFIVRIAPGAGTEMIGIFEGPGSYRRCLGRPKSLQLITET